MDPVFCLLRWEDYRYTGDTTPLLAHFTDLKAKTLQGLEHEDGLIAIVDPPVPASVNKSNYLNDKLKNIVDWPVGEHDGYKMVPVNTVINAFHCRSLEMMAEMADAATMPCN